MHQLIKLITVSLVTISLILMSQLIHTPAYLSTFTNTRSVFVPKEKATLSFKHNTAETEEQEVSIVEPEKLVEYSATDYFSSTSTKYVNISSLNMREGPSTDYPVTTLLYEHDQVEVGSNVSDTLWVAVRKDTAVGFVHHRYLSDQPTTVIEKDDEQTNTDTTTDTKPTNQTTAKNDKEETATTAPTKDTHSPQKNRANQLSTVSANNQVILVTTPSASSQKATIETFERDANGHFISILKTSGFVGKNGITTSKKEGDGKTPAGKYSIGTAFGIPSNPGTALNYRKISDDDVWVDDSESALYNTWQSRQATQDQWSSAENMKIPQYRYGFVINYNTNRTPYKGSAIFFHVANNYTLGCVGTSESHVKQILTWLNPSQSPVIIQTTDAGLSQY
ncbi:hypothetical protein GCM10012290_07650 [Halolactibacillus alkaliphilus]|uniref:Uncharacterized protein n=1 Tax=Halolactibacillus alkaliphilus TaxID=442899 RepID=A0A511WZG7_9BACI|nr:L,D-transpeptidase family protein [Halolactibacillus alkaliphilus]GEN56081.1 hypothetical protein HAL01_05450 [Halolactibacillus alkaliphilus]GGN67305.1 hypothetical protein GCM10012290_07650 [Halolactibacillus alkaliphilus]SFO71145.1 L,D-peptidoglycan transpeptidase YkuD, ErfK/YbiS/YcfS/YnhG family [Halolactibacillus alkaliphilus]